LIAAWYQSIYLSSYSKTLLTPPPPTRLYHKVNFSIIDLLILYLYRTDPWMDVHFFQIYEE
jgi:hypothetical protein